MGRYKLTTAVLVILTVASSCTAPESRHKPVEPEYRPKIETVEAVESEQAPETAETTVRAEAEEFDPASITPEVYEETKQDIFNFIQNLNSIIKARRYSVWMRHLDTDYYQYINSPDYLRELSKAEVLASKKIVLSDAYDYFTYVVVPSRSNDRVDDIEFVSETRIRAININNGRRVILYDLAKTQDGWKIVKSNSVR